MFFCKNGCPTSHGIDLQIVNFYLAKIFKKKKKKPPGIHAATTQKSLEIP
jgi:hypothetical protein